MEIFNQGQYYRELRGVGENPPHLSASCKLLSQSAKLDWLMITPEQTKMDNIVYSFICKSREIEYVINILCFITLNLANKNTKSLTYI